MTETGESNASFRRRSDNLAWPEIRNALENGAVLKRPAKLDSYFAFKNGDYFGKNLTKPGVAKLEKDGVLILGGVETYVLNLK